MQKSTAVCLLTNIQLPPPMRSTIIKTWVFGRECPPQAAICPLATYINLKEPKMRVCARKCLPRLLAFATLPTTGAWILNNCVSGRPCPTPSIYTACNCQTSRLSPATLNSKAKNPGLAASVSRLTFVFVPLPTAGYAMLKNYVFARECPAPSISWIAKVKGCVFAHECPFPCNYIKYNCTSTSIKHCVLVRKCSPHPLSAPLANYGEVKGPENVRLPTSVCPPNFCLCLPLNLQGDQCYFFMFACKCPPPLHDM